MCQQQPCSFCKKEVRKITEKTLDAEQGPNNINLPTVLLLSLLTFLKSSTLFFQTVRVQMQQT